jgi:hypothetical protein
MRSSEIENIVLGAFAGFIVCCIIYCVLQLV